MGLKRKIVKLIRKIAGNGYVSVDDIRHRGG